MGLDNLIFSFYYFIIYLYTKVKNLQYISEIYHLKMPEEGLIRPDCRSGRWRRRSMKIFKLVNSNSLITSPINAGKMERYLTGINSWLTVRSSIEVGALPALSLMRPPIAIGYYSSMKKTTQDSWTRKAEFNIKRLPLLGIKL